jgi:hypothetical protein
VLPGKNQVKYSMGHEKGSIERMWLSKLSDRTAKTHKPGAMLHELTA